MSNVIDSKVVEMKFDNQDFEKNVSTSMNTLDKLQNKLNFSDANKAFGELDSASRKVDFGAFGQAIETVQVKFKALETIAIGALMNIGAKAADAGIKLVNSLSTDQVAAGWEKYADKTTAVQTIMAATSDQFEDTAEQMEYVSNQLAKLNWFTDETSYNFVDMTSNIGKFTSAGVDLETAVIAMQGIAAEAAISGQNAQAASRAMYNFSQALGAGAVKVQDWMSIENANMATKEFKETLIQTAEELGVIKKGSVTFQNFRENLKDGWLNADVLMKSLERYGAFSVELGNVMEEVWENTSSFTTSQFVKFVEDYKNGSREFSKWAKMTGLEETHLTEIITKLGSAEYDLGFRSFKAAQEAKTFAEAIDSVKDAVSTGWMNTFEHIFGNYEQAKELWTTLANELYDLFAVSGEERNALLADWASQTEGGRQDFIDAFWTMWGAIKDVINTINEAMREIFPPTTTEDLQKLVLKFKEFAESLKMSEEQLGKLKRTFKGVFSVFKIAGSIIKQVFSAFAELMGGIEGVNIDILDSTATIGDWITSFADLLEEQQYVKNAIVGFGNFVKNTYNKIKESVQKFIDIPVVRKIIDTLGKMLSDLWNGISEHFANVGARFSEFLETASQVEDLQGLLSLFGSTVKQIFSDFIASFSNTDESSGSILDNIINNVKNFFANIGTYATDFYDSAVKFFADFGISMDDFSVNAASIFENVKKAFEGFFTWIGQSFQNVDVTDITGVIFSFVSVFLGLKVNELITNFATLTSSFKKFLSAGTTLMKSFTAKNSASVFTEIGKGILYVAAAVALLALTDSKFPIKKSADTIQTLMLTMGGIAAGISIIMGIFKAKGVDADDAGNMLSGIGLGVLAIAGAIALLASLDINPQKLTAAIWGIAGIIITLAGTTMLMNAVSKESKTSFMTLIGMALSVLMLVSAIKQIADMSPGSLNGALKTVMTLIMTLGGIFALCEVFGGKYGSSFKLISNGASIGQKRTLSGGSISSGMGFAALGMALAVIVLLEAIKMAADMKPETLMGGLSTVKQLVMLLGGVMIASIAAGKNADKAGAMIMAMSVSLLILIGAVNLAAGIDDATLSKGIGFIAGATVLFGLVIALSHFSGENATKAGLMLIEMAAAIWMLVGVIAIFRWIDDAALTRGLIAIGVIGAVFAGILAATGLARKAKSGPILSILGLVLVMSVVIGVLAFLNLDEKIFNIATGLGILMAVLIGSLFVLTKLSTGPGSSSKLNILLFDMIALLAATAMILLAISQLQNPDACIPIAISMGILIGIMIAAVKLLENAKGMSIDAYAALGGIWLVMILLGLVLWQMNDLKTEGLFEKIGALTILVGDMLVLMLAMTLIGAVLSAGALGVALIGLAAALLVIELLQLILVQLQNLGDMSNAITNALAIQEVAIALAIGIGALGVAGLLAVPAVLACVALIVFAVALFSLLELLGGLSDQEDNLRKGLAILELLGESIGNFLGSIVTGFLDKTLDKFPEYGTKLSNFATNLGPFLDMLAQLKDQDLTTSMQQLASAMLVIGGAELVNAIANFINAKVDKEDLSSKLSSFADTYTSFADKIQNAKAIPKEKMDSIVRLATLADILPKFGGLLQAFTGTSDMTKVGIQLKNFGESYVNFSKSVVNAATLKEGVLDDMMAVANLFGNPSFKFDGITQWFEGTTNLDNVGGQLQRFAQFFTRFVGFANEADKLSDSVLSDMTAVIDWVQKIPVTGGVAQWFAGEIQIDDFGYNLAEFIKGYSEFANGASETKNVSSTKLANMLEVINWMDSEVPDWLSDKSLKLYEIGRAISEFAIGYNALAGSSRAANTVNMSGLRNVMSVVTELGAYASDEVNAINISWLKEFSGSLNELGTGFATFATMIAPVDFDKADRANLWIEKFMSLIRNSNNSDVNEGARLISRGLIEMVEESIGSFSDKISNISGKVELSALAMAKAFTTNLKDAFTDQNAQSNYVDILVNVRGFFNNLVENVEDDLNYNKGRLTKVGKAFLNYIIDGMNLSNDLSSTLNHIIDTIVSKFNQRRNSFYTIGEYFMQGFKQGMESYENVIANSADHLGFVASEALRKALDEHSPSKITEEIGKFFTQGFAQGIDGATNDALSSVANLGERSTSELEKTLSTIGSFVDGNMDITPTISPVLDLSNVTSGLNDLGGLFGATRSIDFSSYAGDLFNSNLLSSKNSLSAKDFKMEELFSGLSNKLTELTSKVGNLQVVMDTGTLVGQITGPLDSALGTKISRNTRGGV